MAYIPLSAIQALAKAVHDEIYSVANTLKRRGFIFSGHGAMNRLVLPKDMSKLNLDKYYEYMGRRTFRNILKNIIAKRENISRTNYLGTCSDAKLSEYFDFLCSIGVVHLDNHSSLYSLAITANDFGPTLEWYIAELFKRELASTSDWGVRIRDVKPGGDFDVMARVESALVWVEAKSSRPENISESDIKHFLQRDQNLDPNISIFFVDTRDDLSGLIQNFEKIITPVVDSKRYASDPSYHLKIKKLTDFGDIYYLLRRIYIINSQPNILANLRNCLRHYFTEVPYMTYFSREEKYKFL